jgi:hypothetical protein
MLWGFNVVFWFLAKDTLKGLQSSSSKEVRGSDFETPPLAQLIPLTSYQYLFLQLF